MEELEIPMPVGKGEPFLHSCNHLSMTGRGERGGGKREREREIEEKRRESL